MTSFLSEDSFFDTNINCLDYNIYIDFLRDYNAGYDYSNAINSLETQADKNAGFNVIFYKFKYPISDGCEITISDVIDAKGKTTRQLMNLLSASLALNTAILGDTDAIYFQGINAKGECVIET